jgi:hypothetical protein
MAEVAKRSDVKILIAFIVTAVGRQSDKLFLVENEDDREVFSGMYLYEI